MKNKDVVLVCVTPQLSCKTLICVGKALADEMNASVRILCAFPKYQCSNPNIGVLEELSAMAGEISAEMTVCFSNSPAESAAKYATAFAAVSVVTGMPGERSSNFITEFHTLLPNTPLSMVDSDGTAYSITTPEREQENFIAAKAQDHTSFKYSVIKL